MKAEHCATQAINGAIDSIYQTLYHKKGRKLNNVKFVVYSETILGVSVVV